MEDAPPPLPPSRRGRSRRLLTMAVLVLAVVGAFAGYRYYPSWSATTDADYVTAVVDAGPIEQTVSATGTLNPVTTVQVGTYVSGPIIAIDVDFNSPVKKGQRVAKIDPAPFAVKVRQAQANLLNAQAKVQKDRADLELKRLLFERNKVLVAKNLNAQVDLDTAKSNYDQAVAQLALDQAAVAQAQASLEEGQINLRYTDILSPVDGVVVSRNVDVGQTVAASFQTPTLFLIAVDLAKMQVDTNVSESDVGRVDLGQPVSFTVDAYPAKPFPGTVAQVRNAPITVQNVVTYDVVVAVDNPDLELKPGMTANVTITTAHRDHVVRVPIRALRFRPESAQGPAAENTPTKSTRAHAATAVFLVDADNTLHRTEVKTGIRDGQYAEVLDGAVREGDRVATGIHRETTESAPTGQPPRFPGRRF